MFIFGAHTYLLIIARHYSFISIEYHMLRYNKLHTLVTAIYKSFYNMYMYNIYVPIYIYVYLVRNTRMY